MFKRQLTTLIYVGYIYGAYLIWQLTGIETCGWTLIGALSSENETARTVAGILLVRAPDKARPLIREAIAEKKGLRYILPIAAEVADEALEIEVRSFISDSDLEVRIATERAIRIIVARRSGRPL
ncbi:MAG: hypothetical protein AB7G68_12410 [Nitrospiraceae bacterium]